MLCRSLSLVLLLSAVAVAHSSSEESGEKNATEHVGHHHHYHHRGRHGFRHHQPEFLKDLSKEVKKEYFDIVFDRNSTKAEIKKSVAAWAKKSGVEVRNLFFSYVLSLILHRFCFPIFMNYSYFAEKA